MTYILHIGHKLYYVRSISKIKDVYDLLLFTILHFGASESKHFGYTLSNTNLLAYSLIL